MFELFRFRVISSSLGIPLTGSPPERMLCSTREDHAIREAEAIWLDLQNSEGSASTTCLVQNCLTGRLVTEFHSALPA